MKMKWVLEGGEGGRTRREWETGSINTKYVESAIAKPFSFNASF